MYHSSPLPEEDVSYALYKAAKEDKCLQVVSWQAVDGKSYFATDIKLRLPNGERAEPDLIIASSRLVWLIEVKSLHSESIADEIKLKTLLEGCSHESLLNLISLHSGIDVTKKMLEGCVAYSLDDTAGPVQCSHLIGHIEWPKTRANDEKFGDLLNRLERTIHDPSG